MDHTQEKHRRFLLIDILALLTLLGFTVGYLHIITHSVNSGDESCYLTWGHRLILGDQPITDEWHLAQMMGILLFIPFRAFHAITGSTDGIILFFRALYTFCQLSVTAYVYISLRIYGDKTYARPRERKLFAIGALIASGIFACFIPVCIPTLSYYTMSLMGLIVLSVTLFCYPAGKFRFFFCGVVFDAVVLAEPASAFLYLLYIVLLVTASLINRFHPGKIAARFFSGRFPLFFNLGILTAAIPVTVVFFLRNGTASIFGGIRHLFDGTEYVFSGSGKNIVDTDLYKTAISVYGKETFIALAVITLMALLLYKFRRYTRLVLTIAAAATLTVAYMHAWQSISEFGSASPAVMFHGLPLYLTGPFWMLLSKKPDKRLCIAWSVCFVFSVLFSLSSAICIGWGGIAATVFSVMIAFHVIIECIQEVTPYTKKPEVWALAVALIVCIVIPSAAEGQWFHKQNSFFFVESELVPTLSRGKLDTKITDGPHKGIVTTGSIAVLYKKMLNDLAEIKQLTSEDDSVFIAALAPWHYLSLERKYGTFTAWYLMNEYDRLELYWGEHPDRIPTYIYIPYYSIYGYRRINQIYIADAKIRLDTLLDYESFDGQAGEILHVVNK